MAEYRWFKTLQQSEYDSQLSNFQTRTKPRRDIYVVFSDCSIGLKIRNIGPRARLERKVRIRRTPSGVEVWRKNLRRRIRLNARGQRHQDENDETRIIMKSLKVIRNLDQRSYFEHFRKRAQVVIASVSKLRRKGSTRNSLLTEEALLEVRYYVVDARNRTVTFDDQLGKILACTASVEGSPNPSDEVLELSGKADSVMAYPEWLFVMHERGGTHSPIDDE